MFQAIEQQRVGSSTIPFNIRMGGWSSREACVRAACLHSVKNDRPVIVNEYGRGIVGMAQRGTFTAV
jgi:hypothetical protein